MSEQRPFRGWKKQQLLRELASGEFTTAELAEKYDVTPQTINYHARANAAEIGEIQADFENIFAGNWIAKKEHRLAELRADVEQINEALDKQTSARLMRVKQQALRQAAEELGQLTQQVSVEGPIHYVVEGVDMSKLT